MNLPQLPSSSSVLTIAARLLQEAITPHAAEIDRDSRALEDALNQLGQANLLALKVPRSLGGWGVDDLTFGQFQALLARTSGALAFLQAQHQSAGAILSHSNNAEVQQAYLPRMAIGEARVGVSFAHLRRHPSPVRAIATLHGYRITGESPWVTGYGIFQTFIVAATLPDGQAVYGMVPFRTISSPTVSSHTPHQDGGTIACGKPMELAAMSSTATVAVQFQDWFLPQSQVVCLKPVSAIPQSDRLNVLQHSFFALGCAAAGLDILDATAEAKQLLFLRSTHTQLSAELADCRQKIFAARSGEEFAVKLELRAWAIDLAVRCAHAAVAASSGAANQSHHAAQRVYREALAFTVSGQTTAVMEATLARLARSSPSHWNNLPEARD
ncbi:MAG TPA: acyl-CoA dehydrogenase family protein [Thermosynechococcaceae cyanobacterium]